MRVKVWDVDKNLALRKALWRLKEIRKCESPFLLNDCQFGFKPCPYASICRAIQMINEELENPNYVEYAEI